MSTPSNKISVVFFGTHDFATQILQGLIDSPLIEIKLVITQPDKPVGRKQILEKTAVKVLAEKHGIKIDQPVSLKTYKLIPPQRDPVRCGTNLSRRSGIPFATGQTCKLGVCAQYGLLIPKHILETPKHGIINVHTSLLPKYRGASPIQSALINGETETGITIMKMDAGMDTGPVLLQKPLKIEPDDTYPTLSQKLSKTAIFALTETLNGYISGQIIPQPQDNSKATYTKILMREDGKINWSKSAQEIYNQYRGLTPWPGIWTTWQDQRLKLLEIKLAKLDLSAGQVSIENDKIYIGCNNKAIEITKLQLEGKQATDAKTFINGHKQIHGEILK